MPTSPLLDGLLDAEEDLHLLSLSLQSSPHAAQTYHAILRSPAHPAPPPSTLTLYTPTLPLPWAGTLQTALRRYLNLYLLPAPAPPPHKAQMLLAAIRSYPIPEPVAEPFYRPLPPSQVAHNASTLAHLRRTAPPAALARVAICVKLSFAMSVRRALYTASSMHYTMPLPPAPLTRTRRTRAASVQGHWVVSSAGRRHAYLVQGELIPARVAPRVAQLLLARYAVELLLNEPVPAPHPAPGSLAALSNAGGALLHAPRAPRLVAARGPPRTAPPDLEMYMRGAFGMSWRRVVASLVNEAESGLRAESAVAEPKMKERRAGVERQIDDLRDVLVRRVVELETAGARLSTMCAYFIAGSMPCSQEVDQMLERFSDEYRGKVHDARCRLLRLEEGIAECFEGQDLLRPALGEGA